MNKFVFLYFILLPFQVFAQRNPCQDIKTTEDKLRGWKAIHSPYKDMIVIQRVLRYDNKDSTFLQINVKSSVSNQGNKGVYVLFEDDSVYREPEMQISEYYIAGSFVVVANIYLTEANLLLFRNKKILKVGVGALNKSVSSKLSALIPAYIECIIK